MSNFRELVNPEIPGFMPVLLDPELDEWGVVRISDKTVVQAKLHSEPAARRWAGTASIRLRIKEYAREAVKTVAHRAVVAFETAPHTEEYGRGELELDVRGDIVHCLETELPKWMHEIFENIDSMSCVHGTGDELAKAKER